MVASDNPFAACSKSSGPRLAPQWRKRLALVGCVAFGLSLLPWLGLGGYAFVVPGWGIVLPRLHLIHSTFLYDAISIPLQFIALIPPLDDIIYFSGEGRATVRPFVVFLFWFLVGLVCLWIALRRTRSAEASATPGSS
jgi:hypothetical protein